jgi:transposase
VRCHSGETITQPPAPSHPIARGRAGPELLAHVLFSKYCLLPLNRQSTAHARKGIELDVSTLADWVGACRSMLTTMTCRFRPTARLARPDCGRMYATTNHSTRLIAAESIRSTIWRAMPA